MSACAVRADVEVSYLLGDRRWVHPGAPTAEFADEIGVHAIGLDEDEVVVPRVRGRFLQSPPSQQRSRSSWTTSNPFRIPMLRYRLPEEAWRIDVDLHDLDFRAVRPRENAESHRREHHPSRRTPGDDGGGNHCGWTRTPTAFDGHADEAHRQDAHLA